MIGGSSATKRKSATRPNVMMRLFSSVILSSFVRQRATHPFLRAVLATVARQCGRIDLAGELEKVIPQPSVMPEPTPAVAHLYSEALRLAGARKTLPQAAKLVRMALDRAPEDVACLGAATMILTMQKKYAEAEMLGRKATQAAPDCAPVFMNLGNCLHQQDRKEEALECYRRAVELAPGLAQAHFNLGNCLRELKRDDEALGAYRAAVEAAPDEVFTLHALGNILLTLNRLTEAETVLTAILGSDPDHVPSLHDLGCVYLKARRFQKAESCLRDAIRKSPRWHLPEVNLAWALLETKRPDEALAAARAAVKLEPKVPETHHMVAAVLQSLDRLDEAEATLRKALAIDGSHADSLLCLGAIRAGRRSYDDADRIFRRILVNEPNRASAHFNRGLLLLRWGRLAEGFREYQWRWDWANFTARKRDYPQPQWSLNAAKGSRVLLYFEQGMGDGVQMLRYVPMVASLGYQLVIEVQEPLVRLTRTLGVGQVFAEGQQLPEFDFHLPLMDLPVVFGTTLETIPKSIPYLAVGESDKARWQARLTGPRRFSVGLAWAGRRAHRGDLVRSMSLDILGPLLDMEGVRFVSLQKELRDGDAEAMRALDGRLDPWADEFSDLADTAAAIATLDLVISVDTVVVHVAGALNCPVWVMTQFDSDWRWLLDRDDSPWYPSARIFRQSAPGDWSEMVSRIAEELRKKISSAALDAVH